MTTLLRRALSLVLLVLVPSAPAQPPGLRATSARFDVAITDGVATVLLALGVRNDGETAGEAVWVLPLPDGAVADGFTTRIGEAPAQQGEVLDAHRARTAYEAIVRARRDPGLLEYAGRGCLRARLGPIPPRTEAEVTIRWRQVLEERGGLVCWSQPLATAGVEGRPPEQVAFTARVRSRQTIRTALSPTPGADVRLDGEHDVVAAFRRRAGQPLPAEIALYYGLSDEAFGLHALAHRDGTRGGEAGWFALLVSPKESWDDVEVAPRAVTFVVDVSGSMKGKKLAQAKGALRRFLQGLRPVDRFDVVPFAAKAEPFFGATVEASAANVARALARADALQAEGGTNLEAALRRGLPDGGRGADGVPLCVLLSDGRATEGETDVEALRTLARTLARARDARVFALGVGDDVHAVLLDEIAATARGTPSYVRPDEDIEAKASELLRRIGKPVMTDLALSIDGAGITRLAPSPLPDLFAGTRLVVTGRYATPGRHVVRLRGDVGGVPRVYTREVVLPEHEPAHDFVPKLWATRCLAGMLDEIRRQGPLPELIDAVRRFGLEQEIVTPYTSHLVAEEALGIAMPGGPAPRASRPTPGAPRAGGGGAGVPAPSGPGSPGSGAYRGPGDSAGVPAPAIDLHALGLRLQAIGALPADASPADVESLARAVADEMQQSARGLGALAHEATGARAVDDSVRLAGARDATTTDCGELYLGGSRRAAGASPAAWIARFVRTAGGKVFLLRAGIWTDRALDGSAGDPATRTVVAFSDGYFALLRERPELCRYAALGERVRVLLGDVLVEITPAAGAGDEVR